MGIAHVVAALLLAAPADKPAGNLDAVSGTWVLQQVGSRQELDRLLPRAIAPALATPKLRGFSLRVPWRAVHEDFALLDAGREIARERKLAFSIRFMAGRHTPKEVFEKGCRSYLRRGERVPVPFLADGSPNLAFEKQYDAFVGRLADWCRRRGVRLLHLAWYGQDWAELNHGKEVRALPGYSYENWLRAHKRLLDIGLKHADAKLAVELPFSGYGPLTEAAAAFADHVVAKLGPADPRFFCQANGWGPRGEWGAPSPQTEASFDRVWSRPICRGLQAIQPQDFDWPAMFARLYAAKATYCEIYAPSFTRPNRAQLAQEIARFARHCQQAAPAPVTKQEGIDHRGTARALPATQLRIAPRP